MSNILASASTELTEPINPNTPKVCELNFAPSTTRNVFMRSVELKIK